MTIEKEQVDFQSYRNTDYTNLVFCCLEGNDNAWNEFFSLFLPLINDVIAQTLQRCGHRLSNNEDEPVGDIREKIITNLHNRGWLSKCVNLEGLEVWLETVVRNQTIGWIRKQHRIKTMPMTDSEKYHYSIDELVGESKNIFYGDVLKNTDSTSENVCARELLSKALINMNAMEKNDAYWILRLSILAQDVLSEKECQSLSVYSGKPLEQIENDLAIIIERLEKKIIAREMAAAHAVVLWHKLRRCERRLINPHSELTENQRCELQEKITQIERLRDDSLRASNVECRPSNKEIAGLLSLPKKKVGQISVILMRIREKLRDK